MNYKTTMHLYKNAVKRIMHKMPKNLSDLEKARYIYVNLGQLFSFDENFWYGNSKIMNKIYTKAITSPVDFNNLQEDKKEKAICVNINKTYNAVLRSLGIETYAMEGYYGDSHISSAFKIDKNIYYCDLELDIKFLQLHLDTHNFCTDGSTVLSQKMLNNIDYKIGYSNIGQKFENYMLEKIRSKMESCEHLSDKLDLLFETVPKLPGAMQLEHTELRKLYKFFIKKTLTGNEELKTFDTIIYQKEGLSQRKNYQLIYSCCDNIYEKNSFKRYLLNNETKKFEKISTDDLQHYIKDNHFKIVNNKKLPGVRKKDIFPHGYDYK